MLVKSQIKYIQSLGQKEHRDAAGVFIAEGPKLVTELIEAVPAQVIQVFATQEWMAIHRPASIGTDLVLVTNDELKRISQMVSPNQVLAVVKKFISPPAIDINGRLVLALDRIQDPGNLGTIIRIADWYGIEQVVCSHDCADFYNPKVVQATMGSMARVSVIYMDLAAWLSSEKGTRIFAAVLEGQDVTKMQKVDQGIIVIGNESKGISDEILKWVNVRITIPRKGRAESLNAAVATGIILSHFV